MKKPNLDTRICAASAGISLEITRAPAPLLVDASVEPPTPRDPVDPVILALRARMPRQRAEIEWAKITRKTDGGK